MGKVDDLRAMREARYEARAKPQSRAKPQPRTAIVRSTQGQATDVDDNKGAPYTCGHKGIGGKSCTRAKDHQEKNHRYK